MFFVLASEQDYADILKSLTQKEDSKRKTLIYKCKYTDSFSLRSKLISFLSAKGTVFEDSRTNILIIADEEDNIKELKKIIEKLDKPIPQIMVEARIVEFTMNNIFEKTANLNYLNTNLADVEAANNAGSNQTVVPSADDLVRSVQSVVTPLISTSNLPQSGGQFELFPWIENSADKRRALGLTLRFLETNGLASVLASPNIMVLLGEQSNISTGEDIPITTTTISTGTTNTSVTFKNTGVKLRVKALAVIGNRVRLSINPEVSNVARTDNGNPVIGVRKASTILELKEGELISIGGLFRDESATDVSRVPYLSNIPILGWFFTGKRKRLVRTQLMIFLTVKILYASDKAKIYIPSTVTAGAKPYEQSVREKFLNAHSLEDSQEEEKESKQKEK